MSDPRDNAKRKMLASKHNAGKAVKSKIEAEGIAARDLVQATAKVKKP